MGSFGSLMDAPGMGSQGEVWVVGGDGAFGDIGFQNVSKVILQNRPNVKMLMLDTQVYSNTGGQNSDSSTMLGGYDMNQFGVASQGKLTEKKNVAEALTSGHGSPPLLPPFPRQRNQCRPRPCTQGLQHLPAHGRALDPRAVLCHERLA